MTIIKEPVMEATCETCGCEFKYDKEDIKTKWRGTHKHPTSKYFYIVCPICNTGIHVFETC